MEFNCRVSLEFLAGYVSDRLSSIWGFNDEICKGFYNWFESIGYFEGDILDFVDNCLRCCQYTTKESGEVLGEVLFETDNFIVFSW